MRNVPVKRTIHVNGVSIEVFELGRWQKLNNEGWVIFEDPVTRRTYFQPEAALRGNHGSPSQAQSGKERYANSS